MSKQNFQTEFLNESSKSSFQTEQKLLVIFRGSYPPAYLGCHSLQPKVLSSDMFDLVCSSPSDYGLLPKLVYHEWEGTGNCQN